MKFYQLRLRSAIARIFLRRSWRSTAVCDRTMANDVSGRASVYVRRNEQRERPATVDRNCVIFLTVREHVPALIGNRNHRCRLRRQDASARAVSFLLVVIHSRVCAAAAAAAASSYRSAI